MRKAFQGFSFFIFCSFPLQVVAADLVTTSGSVSPTNFKSTPVSSKWTLVFSDEFNGTSLDLSKWRPYGPWPQGGDTQNYMMKDEVSVKGGVLKLRAQRRNAGGRPYMSGGVDTHFTFSQTYGKWEIRARVPKGVGLLPYAGIFPSNDVWPPEIDIVEVLGKKTNEVVMTNHWGVWPQHYYKSGIYPGPDFSQGFHTFTVEWYPDKIRWLVDGVERHVSTEGLHNIPSKFAMALGVFNCGAWAGCPDESVIFPKFFEVDYVRIYKLN